MFVLPGFRPAAVSFLLGNILPVAVTYGSFAGIVDRLMPHQRPTLD